MIYDEMRSQLPREPRIDLERADSVRHWSETLGVSERDLRAAVGEVGTSAEKVREHLVRHGAIDPGRQASS